MPGERNMADLGEPSVIPALQSAIPCILQNLRSDALGFTGNNRIHPLHDLVYAPGCVNAAHDDRHTLTPEVSRYFIGAGRLRGESGNAHQVRSRHGRIVRCPEVLVHDGSFPLRRGQARENHKAERFPHTKTVPTALLDFENAYQRVGGVDQME
jgi:hypothetical protein